MTESPLKTASIALGLTELYTLFLTAPLIHPRHSAVYHWQGTALSLFLPVFLDLAILWSAFFLLLRATQERHRLQHVLWAALLSITPPALSHEWDLIWSNGPSPLTTALFYAVPFAFLALLFARRLGLARPVSRLIHVASSLLLFLSVGAVFLLAQLAWFAWQARSLNNPPAFDRAASTSTPHPRIVWLVFDELSFEQVYERRYPGLELPAFDALAAQSTLFTHVTPAGIFTDRVLPSLLSGSPADLVSASAAGMPSLHNPATGAWLPFDQHNTVFADARHAGYRTAVAGWYIPYCRILPDVLDRCFWSYNIAERNGLFPRATLARNMLQPLTIAAEGNLLNRLVTRLAPTSDLPVRPTRLHIDDYQALANASDQILLDPSSDFVLLHIPVPHLGGIYNRHTHRLSTGPSNYLDNLALADAFLAHLRQVLEQTRQWDATTLLVMGDHSWRTSQMWADSPTWTTEEQKASRGGQFDDRPAYILKLPHQQTPTRMDTPFPAIETRHLLQGLMQGTYQQDRQLRLP